MFVMLCFMILCCELSHENIDWKQDFMEDFRKQTSRVTDRPKMQNSPD